MKLITLHDHMNPDQEVLVDADSITSVVPFGSGSAIQCGGGLEFMKILKRSRKQSAMHKIVSCDSRPLSHNLRMLESTVSELRSNPRLPRPTLH